MRKLNSYKLLLVLATGLLSNPQSIWANDDIYKPDTIVFSGQYSVGDNFEALGKPTDIGC